MKKKEGLGQFLSARRKYMRMTQEELAARIHVSKSAIAKWENNGGIPDRDNLRALAEVMNIKVDDMYHVIDRDKGQTVEPEINITRDVIALLESYGYKVHRGE